MKKLDGAAERKGLSPEQALKESAKRCASPELAPQESAKGPATRGTTDDTEQRNGSVSQASALARAAAASNTLGMSAVSVAMITKEEEAELREIDLRKAVRRIKDKSPLLTAKEVHLELVDDGFRSDSGGVTIGEVKRACSKLTKERRP